MLFGIKCDFCGREYSERHLKKTKGERICYKCEEGYKRCPFCESENSFVDVARSYREDFSQKMVEWRRYVKCTVCGNTSVIEK